MGLRGIVRSALLIAAAVVWSVRLSGCSKKPTPESAPKTPDTVAAAVDTNDSILQKDETLAFAVRDASGGSGETIRATDSVFRRREEMMSPANKRKWFEERFPSAAKATDGDGQTSDENTESYSDEINCVINNVIPEFSQWEEFKYRPDSPVMDLLYFTSSPIRPVSFRLFELRGKSSRRACIWIEIWKMRSSAAARKIDTLCYDNSRDWEMEYGLYSPKSYFVFKEYFILVHGCSYEVDRRIYGINKLIKKKCFDCGAIDGESRYDAGNKYSCYSDKAVFGQNDKDW